MKVAIVLFALAWGVSPVFLIWMLIKIAEKAKQLPRVQTLLNATEQEKNYLENELGATRDELEENQNSLHALGNRLLKDNVKFIGSKVTASNYASSKKHFETLFGFCEKNRYPVPKPEQRQILDDLKESFEEAVRKQWHKEEQARIKRQIREEEKLEAERQRELQRLENQELAVQTALQKALQRAKDEHDEEVERLRGQLEEAQAKLERAKSMAELTKAGFVYVISNLGSFGESVYKVGMTRRLEPLDRVHELGDASVPFPYDVHMMISSNDAPALETALHQELHKFQLNRVNPRKEFFKVNIDAIAKLVEKHHGEVDYIASPEALEYNESLNMSEEDFEYVSRELARFAEDEEGYRPGTPPRQSSLPRRNERRSSSAQAKEAATAPTPIRHREMPAPKEGTVTTAQPAEPSTQARRVLACPHCKGDIFADTLVDGENTCPHCAQRFKVRRSK